MSNAYDSPNWRNENRSGGSNDNRPNHMSNGKGNGGPVNSNGMPPGRRAPDGYGTTASASDQQARNRSQSTPNMTTGHSMSSGPSTSFGPPMPAVTAPAGPALRALLSSGNTRADMTHESDRPLVRNAQGQLDQDVHRPAFLHGVAFDANHPGEWFQRVLPYVAGLTFVVNSTKDVYFMGPMLNSPALPCINQAVNKLALPGFHWFSGISGNRQVNPFLQLAALCPRLEVLTLTLHNAGITTSCFGERQMIQLESSDPVRARARRVLGFRDVVAKYDLDGLFTFRSLRRVRVEMVLCARTAAHTREGNALECFQMVTEYLAQGFVVRGLQVHVELVHVERE